MATDVVGYSRMMGADETGTLARLNALRSELLHPKIEAYGGRIVNTTGDGSLIEFPSAVNAVQHAVDLQQALARRNADLPEDQQIELRIGINLGDVIVQDEDVYGDGVNVAARLEGLAEPGGICVSAKVHDEVKGRLDLSFDDLGPRQFKNIAQLVHVYRPVVTQATHALGGDARSEPVFRLPSIAVLPFENMSGDEEQEYFADGITEDLITALSRVRQFRVVARNSTYAYKGQSPDVRDVAKQLGVGYVIEGSVRRASNRIRLTAQLIDGITGEHYWSQRYDRDLEDIFGVQDELVQAVVGALEPELSRAEIQRARSKAADSLDAWDLYQRGMSHFNRRTKDDIARARQYFERAISSNAEFGAAYSALANAIIYEVLVGVRDIGAGDLKEAASLARKAVEIDESDASAWCWLSRAYGFNRMWDDALSAAQKSLELDPCNAVAYYHLGAGYIGLGRAPEAFEPFGTAHRLSPLDPWVGSIIGLTGIAYLFTEQYENAASWTRDATRQPGPGANLWTIRAALVSALGHLSRFDEAKSELEHLYRVQPGITQSYIRDRFPCSDASYMHRWIEGLRLAGMP